MHQHQAAAAAAAEGGLKRNSPQKSEEEEENAQPATCFRGLRFMFPCTDEQVCGTVCLSQLFALNCSPVSTVCLSQLTPLPLTEQILSSHGTHDDPEGTLATIRKGVFDSYGVVYVDSPPAGASQVRTITVCPVVATVFACLSQLTLQARSR